MQMQRGPSRQIATTAYWGLCGSRPRSRPVAFFGASEMCAGCVLHGPRGCEVSIFDVGLLDLGKVPGLMAFDGVIG